MSISNPDESFEVDRGMMIIRGNFAEGNFGDDALLLSVQGLVAPHYGPEQVCFEGGSPVYRGGLTGYDRPARGDEMSRAAMILYGGGTQFFALGGPDAPAVSLGEKLMKALVNPTRLRTSLNFRRRLRLEARMPVMGVGLGFGPFVGNPAAEESARRLAGRMRFLWVRDRFAAKFARDSGCKAVAEGADLCFLRGFRKENVLHAAQGTVPGRVGIVLRDWPYGEPACGLVAHWRNVARQARAAGMEVLFLSFSPASDGEIVRRLETAGEAVLEWRPDRMTVAEFCAELDRCAFFVTSRFHAAVFALLLGKPFVAIGIEPKLVMVADLLGAADHLAEPDESPEQIVSRMVRVLARMPEERALAAAVRDQQSSLAEAARQQFIEALRSLKGV